MRFSLLTAFKATCIMLVLANLTFSVLYFPQYRADLFLLLQTAANVALCLVCLIPSPREAAAQIEAAEAVGRLRERNALIDRVADFPVHYEGRQRYAGTELAIADRACREFRSALVSSLMGERP